jgi:predicted nucleic acid-binding protein
VSLVVDASVAVRWFVEAPGSSAAATLLEGDEILLAPDLVVSEVVNVAWKLVRAGEISREHGARIAVAIGHSFTRLVPAPQLAERAFALAVELDHPVYDCLYLALAEREGCRLVTADRRLAAKAGAELVTLIG